MKRKPTHPGAILLEDVIKPLNLSISQAADMLGVSKKSLKKFVTETTSINADMAVRISRATNTSPEVWMKLQMKLDLWVAEKNVGEVAPFPTIDYSENNTENNF